jgi:geranylgeranyl diphosphate synthase type II
VAGEAASAVEILKRHAQTLEAHFANLLNRADIPARLLEAIEYSLLAGGKRLRPALVLESFTACCQAGPERSGGPDSSESKSALTAAAAIELIHTFSLVHDDLPAMDDDDLRRGRPTNHKVFGEALAILAGDAMVTMAFELLARDADARVAPRLIEELARAAGPAGMIGGQALDIAAQNQSLTLDDLQNIHRMKTGALLTASCRMGAIAAGASDAQLNALTAYGQHIGLAFQIVDDLLDVTSTPEQLGKRTNKDATRGKNTYPALLGTDHARAAADAHLASAHEAVQPFGPAAENLHHLARLIVQRTR